MDVKILPTGFADRSEPPAEISGFARHVISDAELSEYMEELESVH